MFCISYSQSVAFIPAISYGIILKHYNLKHFPINFSNSSCIVKTCYNDGIFFSEILLLKRNLPL